MNNIIPLFYPQLYKEEWLAALGKIFDTRWLGQGPMVDEFEREFGAGFFENIDDLLPRSDYVSLHVPLLETTRHLIDERRLKLMKSTAYLINTARGPVVDEKALVNALKKGWIRGAAIDVFENEPRVEPELLKLNNIILTPHIASATEETRDKMAVLAAKNIIEALEGRMPPNIVK